MQPTRFPPPSGIRAERAARRHPHRLPPAAVANLRSTAELQQRKKRRAGEPVHTAHARESATTSVRCRGGTDVRSCRSLCLFAAPFDRVQGRVLVLRVGFGALDSDYSDDRAGASGLGAVSHRMTFPLSWRHSPRRRHELEDRPRRQRRKRSSFPGTVNPAPLRGGASAATRPAP